MCENEKKQMLEAMLAAHRQTGPYGWPLRILRRIWWPITNFGLFYLINVIFTLMERIDVLERKSSSMDGMTHGQDFWTQRFMILNTDYLALKKAYEELLSKVENR